MADDAPSELLSRRYQMFPVLSEAEIERIHRFGKVRRYPRGMRLFAVGERDLIDAAGRRLGRRPPEAVFTASITSR